MKLKIIIASSIILCLNTIACRETEDFITEEFNSDNHLEMNIPEMSRQDSTHVYSFDINYPDPPKTGHQWRTKAK